MVRGNYCCAEASGLGDLHDCFFGKRRLMTASLGLIPLEAVAINKSMLFRSPSRTDESLRTASLFESGLALFFRAVELHELGKGHPTLKLD